MLQRISRIPRCARVSGVIQKRFAAGWPADGSDLDPKDWPKQGAVVDYQDMPRQSAGSPMWIVYLSTPIALWCVVQAYYLRPVPYEERTWLQGEYLASEKAEADWKMSEERIFAKGDRGHDKKYCMLGDFDNLVCNLTFRSGTIGSIDISRYASYGYDQRLEVFGPKGLLTVDNDSPTRCEMLQASGNSTAPMYWSFPSRFDRGYVIELEHFFDVVQGQDICSIDAKMTLAATKIVTALEESARAGGQPVKLTWTKQEIPDGYNQTL